MNCFRASFCQNPPAEIEGLLERDVDGQVHQLRLEQGTVPQQLLVPVAHHESHGLLLQGVLVCRIQLDHGIHERPVVVAGAGVDLLLETGQRTERLDMPVAQIELALGDVSGVVRYRMGDVISRHRRDGENRQGSGIVEVDGLLVA